MEQLIVAVKKFAEEHYNSSGWDYIVETQTDSDITEMIGDATSERQAIVNVGRFCNLWNEQREDIQGEIF